VGRGAGAQGGLLVAKVEVEVEVEVKVKVKVGVDKAVEGDD
jgi:hypothetical protein